MSLIVDKNRFQQAVNGEMTQTGIFVRAELDGKFGSYDVMTLERDSLLEWLRSRDDNPNAVVNLSGRQWREQVILVIFGHG